MSEGCGDGRSPEAYCVPRAGYGVQRCAHMRGSAGVLACDQGQRGPQASRLRLRVGTFPVVALTAETAVRRPGDLSTAAQARRSEGTAGVSPATTGRRFPQDSLDGRDGRPPARRPVHGGGGAQSEGTAGVSPATTAVGGERRRPACDHGSAVSPGFP